MAKQRVTLYLDSHLWRMIRLWCVSQGVSASQFVEETMYLRIMDTNMPDLLAHSTPDTTPGKKGERGVDTDKPRSEG